MSALYDSVVMSPLWYLLGIAVFGGWLGLAVLIAWATGRGGGAEAEALAARVIPRGT